MTAMSRQLLSYAYQEENRKGAHEAIQVARQWLQEIFKEPWWPDDSARHLVHYGDGTSCDAVRLTYRASDAAGPLAITVYQTLFFIVVAIGHGPAGELEALGLGRRLFNYAERLNLTASNQGRSGAVGRQTSSGVAYRDQDWLDTIQWWSDGNLVAFEMLKRTGPEQGTIVRPEMEGNLRWFAWFE
jgi:hypothetical protein